MTATIFVRFATKAVPEGFDPIRYYQVYAIDVFDDSEKEHTRFLLADRHGRYQWVDSENLRRFNPRMHRSVIAPPGKGQPYKQEPYRQDQEQDQDQQDQEGSA